MPNIRGIIPAVVTPFDKHDNVDTGVLRTLVAYLVNSGVHGLFVLGSQGEFWAPDYDEKKTILETVMDEVNGRIPVYAGTGGISTRKVLKLTAMAESVGIDAVSILTPISLSLTDEELYNHYEEIGSSTNLPVILYTNADRTGANFSPRLLARLSRIGNIVGIKDSSGDLSITTEYTRETGDDFSVLVGRDTLTPATLLYGGKGSIAATANVVPKTAVEIYESVGGTCKAAGWPHGRWQKRALERAFYRS